MQQLLQSPKVRLIGVTAAGGFGKSSLIAKVCEAAQGFEQVLWTTFSLTYSFAVWGGWLLDELGKTTPQDEDELIIAICQALQQKRYLLVLDNLETLLNQDGGWLDQGYSKFFQRWFAAASSSIILMTSRQQPQLPRNTLNQSHWLSLDGLDLPAGVALLRELEIQGTNSELEDFVKRAGGHPLLLTLAAGLLKDEAGDAADIKALKQNIYQIFGSHHDDPEASLAKILEASVFMLESGLRDLLLLICVFPTPFNLKYLKALRDLETSESQLRQLVKRSLLQEKRKAQEEMWTFQFQPLIQEYLQQYVLEFYRDTGSRLGEANTLQAIGDVLQFLKRSDEALSRYEAALQFYRDIGDRLGEANILQEFGKLQDNPQQALEYLHQAQNLYVQIGDIYSQSRNLLFIADAQLKMGESNAAINSLNEAATLAARIHYIPFQEYAQARIAEINTPSSPSVGIKDRFINFTQKRWVQFTFCFLVGLIAFLLWRR